MAINVIKVGEVAGNIISPVGGTTAVTDFAGTRFGTTAVTDFAAMLVNFEPASQPADESRWQFAFVIAGAATAREVIIDLEPFISSSDYIKSKTEPIFLKSDGGIKSLVFFRGRFFFPERTIYTEADKQEVILLVKTMGYDEDRLAADQGNADAQVSLGICYELALGVPKDDREAARFFKLAADQGNAEAQAALARRGRQQQHQEEERQSEAVARKRQVASNKITEKVTEDEQVIRIAGGSTVNAPRRPVPADFGIIEEDVSRLPKLVFGPPDGSPFRMGLCLATTILIAFIPLNLLVHGDWGHGNWIVALLMGMPLVGFGSILTGLCFRALGRAENKIRSAISPTFGRASQYRSAMDGYRKNLAEYEHWIAAQEEAYWRGLSGVAFEEELARLFRGLGYQVSETPRTGDGGVDLILHKDGRVTVVQCKAHDKRIPIGVARELIASMQDFKAHDAIIACLEGVTGPVQQYIATKPIRVIDVHEILSLQRSLR